MSKKHWILGFLMLVGVLWGRMFYEARSEYHKGISYLSESDLSEAIIHFDRSVHWYAPLNPFTKKSLQALWKVSLQQKGKRYELDALEAIRSSVHSIRSLYRPHWSWVQKVNPRIASLRAQSELEMGSKYSFEDLRKRHMNLLKLDYQPNRFWMVLLQLGFWGSLVCMFGFIWKGFDARGKLQLSRSMPWLGGMLMGLVLWIMGLLQA